MSLRMAALGMLAQQPGSGYDLLKRFEMSMANVWPATQSQLYAELNRLADHGLIEVAEIGPRGRKLYRVTTAGRSELLRWMASPQDDPPYRSPELLRIFLLGELPRTEAAEHVRSLAEHAESELTRLTALRDSPDCADMPLKDFFGFAALQYGLRFQAMQAEWARWLESTIIESDVASR